MLDLYIIGIGGMAKDAAFLVAEINRTASRWTVRGFVTHDRDRVGTTHGHLPVVATDEELTARREPAAVVLAVADPVRLAALQRRLTACSALQFPNLIHPAAIGDWEHITLGQGNLIFPGCVLTTDIRLGDFNLINNACTLGHDVSLGDCNVLNPGVNVSGSVSIADRVLVGTGAQLLQGLSICAAAVVGAGAVVVEPIGSAGTYVGIPARRRRPA